MTPAPGDATKTHALALVAGGLVALRVATTGHAPDVADAVFAAVAGVAVAVAAPPWWSRAALPLAIGAAASIGGSLDPWQSLLSLSLVVGAAAFLGLGAAASLRPGVLGGLLVGGIAHATLALTQRFVLWPDALARRDELQLPPASVERLLTMRPIGLSLSPDLGAALALAGTAVALSFVVDRRRDRSVRVLSVVAFSLLLTAVLLARSFGTAAAVVVAIVVTAVVRRAWRLLGAVAVGGVLAAAAAAARGVHAVVVSASERVMNWRVGWDAFLDAPGTGHGLLRFAAAYAERRPPDANVTRYAHSAPVQVLAETGVVGAVAMIAAAVVVVPRIVRALRAATTPDAIVAAGAVALVARAFIDYDLHVGQTAMIAAAMTGLAAAGAGDRERVDDPATARVHTRPVATGLALLAASLAALLVWRAGADGGSLLARVDVDVALRAAVAEPEPSRRRALLVPFVDRVPAAAIVAARAALDENDDRGALALLERARARDPALAAVHHLLVELARRGHGDVDARRAEALRYGVVVP